MKILYAACLALAPIASGAQSCLAGKPILNDSLPCMERALAMDGGGMDQRSMDDIIIAMCDHKPFAKGQDALVYIETTDELTVTTMFTFKYNKCDEMSVSISYGKGYERRRSGDVRKFMDKFNSLYKSEYDPDQPARYSSYDGASILTYSWKDTFSYMRMDVTERRKQQVVDIERTYR